MAEVTVVSEEPDNEPEVDGDTEAAKTAALDSARASGEADAAAATATSSAAEADEHATESESHADEAATHASESAEAASVSAEAAGVSVEALAALKAEVADLPRKLAEALQQQKQVDADAGISQETEQGVLPSEEPEPIPADEKPHNEHWYYRKLGRR